MASQESSDQTEENGNISQDHNGLHDLEDVSELNRGTEDLERATYVWVPEDEKDEQTKVMGEDVIISKDEVVGCKEIVDECSKLMRKEEKCGSEDGYFIIGTEGIKKEEKKESVTNSNRRAVGCYEENSETEDGVLIAGNEGEGFKNEDVEVNGTILNEANVIDDYFIIGTEGIKKEEKKESVTDSNRRAVGCYEENSETEDGVLIAGSEGEGFKNEDVEVNGTILNEANVIDDYFSGHCIRFVQKEEKKKSVTNSNRRAVGCYEENSETENGVLISGSEGEGFKNEDAEVNWTILNEANVIDDYFVGLCIGFVKKEEKIKKENENEVSVGEIERFKKQEVEEKVTQNDELYINDLKKCGVAQQGLNDLVLEKVAKDDSLSNQFAKGLDEMEFASVIENDGSDLEEVDGSDEERRFLASRVAQLENEVSLLEETSRMTVEKKTREMEHPQMQDSFGDLVKNCRQNIKMIMALLKTNTQKTKLEEMENQIQQVEYLRSTIVRTNSRLERSCPERKEKEELQSNLDEALELQESKETEVKVNQLENEVKEPKTNMERGWRTKGVIRGLTNYWRKK